MACTSYRHTCTFLHTHAHVYTGHIQEQHTGAFIPHQGHPSGQGIRLFLLQASIVHLSAEELPIHWQEAICSLGITVKFRQSQLGYNPWGTQSFASVVSGHGKEVVCGCGGLYICSLCFGSSEAALNKDPEVLDAGSALIWLTRTEFSLVCSAVPGLCGEIRQSVAKGALEASP